MLILSTLQNLNTKIVTKEFDEYISELKNTLGYKDFRISLRKLPIKMLILKNYII